MESSASVECIDMSCDTNHQQENCLSDGTHSIVNADVIHSQYAVQDETCEVSNGLENEGMT